MGAWHLGDGSLAPERAANHTIVIEHGLAVGGDPDVALESGGAESEGEEERLDGVLGGVSARTTVGERDGRIEQGGETLLHPVMMAWRP